MSKPIVVLGAGAWGTALALSLAYQHNNVYLWSYKAEEVAKLQAEGENQRYLPGFPFPPNLHCEHQLAPLLSDASDILMAVPSYAFVETLQAIKPHLKPQARIAWATKGLAHYQDQVLFLSEIVTQELGQRAIALVSGPSFAKEVAAKLPTAVVIAGNNPQFTADLSQRFHSHFFRTYQSEDLIGVQLGGVLKNVFAIAAGIADGMSLGANARCALITRGLAELTRLNTAMGGTPATVTGLAGLGDLVLTCTDNQSRNRRFGLALGRGLSLSEAKQKVAHAVEGYANAVHVYHLAKRYQVEMPIVEEVYQVLYAGKTPQEALLSLMSRQPAAE